MISLGEASQGLLDFHTHSTYSDGGDTPTQLVKRAKEHGVTAIALTDHHVDSGLEEFIFACNQYDIFAMPFGTEIHVELPPEILEEGDNEAPDMVLLGKNPKKAKVAFKEYQTIFQKDRGNRFIPETFYKLKEMGFDISSLSLEVRTANTERLGILLEEMKEELANGNNPEKLAEHVYTVDSSIKREDILKEPLRYVNKYLFAIGQPAFVKRFEGFSANDARAMAEEMRCLLFIAHPGGEYGYLSDSTLEHLIESAHGEEIRNYFNTPEQNKKFDTLAKKHNLIRSAGSDCHGDKGPFKIGCYDRPQNQAPKNILHEIWENLSD